MSRTLASRRLAQAAEPWDFNTCFPTPLPAALEAGVLGSAEVDEEHVAAIHEEVAHEVQGLLAELDRVAEAIRTGLDPNTGKTPRSEDRRTALTALLPTLPKARDRGLDQLLADYIDGFGLDAGCAFRRWLIATHRDVVIYVPRTADGQELVGVSEQDAMGRRERMLADFEELMPGGAGAAWAAGQAFWNVEVAGPFDPDRSRDYAPSHPFYYHLGGLPLTAAEAIAQTPAVTRDHLLGTDRRAPDVAYWRTRLVDARRDLDAVRLMYDRLYREGPRALSEYDRTFGRGNATPVTLWAEMMAGGYWFVAIAAATVKRIEQELNGFPGGVARLVEVPVVHVQMPLFG